MLITVPMKVIESPTGTCNKHIKACIGLRAGSSLVQAKDESS